MTERTQQYDHTLELSKMSGEYASIEYPNIDHILSTEEALGYNYQNLYQIDESNGLNDHLQPPLERVQAGYFFTDRGLHFDGLVDFNPDALEDETARLNWLDFTIGHIIEELEASGVDCRTQSHNPHAVTIFIDGEHSTALRIENTVSQDDMCRVSISTIAGHSKLSPDSNADLLKQFIHAFIASIDSVVRDYAPLPVTDMLHMVPSYDISQMSDDGNSTGESSNEAIKPSLDQLGGLESVKQKLNSIAAAFKHPEAAKLYDIEPTSFLLYGPAGTGKTSLVEAFAAMTEANLTEVKSSDVFEKWIGSSGKAIKDIFSEARSSDSPTVIFLDEFDSFNGDRNDERRDVKNLLKAELSTLPPHVIVAAATNEDISDFDAALMRSGRFEKIYVPLPTEAERADIWATVLFEATRNIQLTGSGADDTTFIVYDLDTINYTTLAERTDGMTAADFKEILRRARSKRFLAHIATLNNEHLATEYLPVTQTDILDEIAQFNLH